MPLPTNIDASHPDDANDASVKTHQQQHDAIHGVHNIMEIRGGLTIVETSTGVWSADAPARTVGHYPITFIGTSDPADATNGINTPANINDGDRWVQV